MTDTPDDLAGLKGRIQWRIDCGVYDAAGDVEADCIEDEMQSALAAIESLQRQLAAARGEREQMRAVVEATARYVHCCSSPEISPYIKENGKYGTMSPWRELCEAVKAAALSPPAAETPKTEETGNG